MKGRCIYIIACFLLSIFAGKEVMATVRLIHAEVKNVCDNCDSRSTEKSIEERGFEQEQKLLTEIFSIQSPEAETGSEKTIYKALYIPAIHLGIITPPPKVK